MTFVLGMLFREADLPFLRLHLPVYGYAFDKVIAASDELDGEAAAYLRSCGVDVIRIDFHEHWADALNQIIRYATEQGHAKFMRLDPDEAVFATDVLYISQALDTYAVLQFFRVNYFYNRLLYNINTYPDVQARAWRLDGRAIYIGRRHEGLLWGNYKEGEVYTNDGAIRIHHYGDASRTSMEARALKYWNANLMDQGLPLVDKLPDDKYPGADAKPYIGAQPLNPYEVGLTAPFSE